MENNPYMGSPEANIYSKNCVVCNSDFIGKSEGPGICFKCVLEDSLFFLKFLTLNQPFLRKQLNGPLFHKNSRKKDR